MNQNNTHIKNVDNLVIVKFLKANMPKIPKVENFEK